ncbi:hypothetical protein Nepgr_016172 [Nepenthes gracilis]|uniref:Disease resistance protein At4g27190-like leucine-rich repeats domain-containing protein n=1 Tax=Nepenthes gracilis TaxID=150966 RepID=A0AAD3SQ03_NEPGR|nr:hypothetical protein Nepgr_016172 [Nepenthes gracilis]
MSIAIKGGNIFQNSRPFFDEKMKFPSLEELTIINLRGIAELWHLANVEDEFPAFPNSENPGDSDALFNNKVALPAIKHIKMSLVDGLQKIWGSHLDVRSFNELESLDIKFVEKATKAFSLDAIQRIRNLKELNLQQFQLTGQFIERVGFYNDEVENSVLLPQLRNLKLDSFPQLKRIPWRELTLQNLRCLQISEIHDLTYLFPASICKRLVNLEALRVYDCHKMKEIVREELGDANTVEVKVVFPHLNFLRLSNLPAFQSLGSDNVILEFPSIKEVDFDKFQNPILWDLLQKLKPVKELQLGRCESLFELHDLKGRSSTMLPRLRNLTLSYMDNLQRIPWMIFPIKNLRYLKISYIHGLKFLFTASMCSEGFAQLEEIHIQDCKDIEQMLAQESIEDTSNNAAPITVVLPRVKIIKLYYLRSLRSFSSENYEALEFPSLEEVEIKEYDKEYFDLNTVIKKRCTTRLCYAR